MDSKDYFKQHEPCSLFNLKGLPVILSLFCGRVLRMGFPAQWLNCQTKGNLFATTSSSWFGNWWLSDAIMIVSVTENAKRCIKGT